MDGRRLRNWLLTGVAACGLAAVGCRSANDTTLPPATLPMSAAQAKGGLFGKPAPQYGPPPAEPAVAHVSKKGQPFSPDTLSAVADTEREAAFEESTPATQRDTILDAARQRYQQALKADPKNKDALTGMAKMYAMSGDKDKAVQLYREALRVYPKDHEIAFKLAKTCYTFGDWHGAGEACTLALSLDPNNRNYLKTLAICAALTGKTDEAVTVLTTNKVMSEAEAQYFIGRTLLSQGKTADAQRRIETAVQLDPQFDQAQIALAAMVNPPPAEQPVPTQTPVSQAGFESGGQR